MIEKIRKSKRRKTARFLLLLAFFVFFTANSLYFIDLRSNEIYASITKTYEFNFESKKKGPYLNLKSAFLVDFETGNVLYAKNVNNPRAIASITKLVAAMVVLDSKIDLNKTAVISKSDARNSSKSRLKRGYELTLYDLLHAGLMNSDNRAMRAIARETYGSYDKFAEEMNKKIKRLGLKKSIFYEPTGLSSKNVSTAEEVAKILHYSYEYKLLAEITSKKRYKVKVLNKKNKRLQMANTNLMVASPYKVLAGKTGYIRAADYCLATLVKNKKGKKLTAVVLGVPGDKLRFKEARKLIDWGFRQLK